MHATYYATEWAELYDEVDVGLEAYKDMETDHRAQKFRDSMRGVYERETRDRIDGYRRKCQQYMDDSRAKLEDSRPRRDLHQRGANTLGQ